MPPTKESLDRLKIDRSAAPAGAPLGPRIAYIVAVIAVIGALLTIFVYLLWVVSPLFRGATLSPVEGAPTLALPSDLQHLSLNEHGDLAFAIGGDGHYRFLSLADGAVKEAFTLDPRGTAANPLGDAELQDKFSRLAALAPRPCDAPGVIAAVGSLHAAPSVRALAREIGRAHV